MHHGLSQAQSEQRQHPCNVSSSEDRVTDAALLTMGHRARSGVRFQHHPHGHRAPAGQRFVATSHRATDQVLRRLLRRARALCAVVSQRGDSKDRPSRPSGGNLRIYTGLPHHTRPDVARVQLHSPRVRRGSAALRAGRCGPTRSPVRANEAEWISETAELWSRIYRVVADAMAAGVADAVTPTTTARLVARRRHTDEISVISVEMDDEYHVRPGQHATVTARAFGSTAGLFSPCR